MLTGSRPHRKHRAPLLGGAVLVAALVLAAGCAGDTAPGSAPPVTVGRPEGPGDPGDLVADEPLEAPPGAALALRITHRSVDVRGEPSLVTAMVIVPERRAADRGVIAWAHPTTGTGDACAPSRSTGPASVAEVDGLLAAGWVIVATDYEGLGAVGSHPYLVSDSEARAIWDSVRAAGQLEDIDLRADDPVVLWGFSQGGHAVLAAAERATSMAPGVDLRGVAAASPVSDVVAFLQRSTQPTQLGVHVSIVHGIAQAAAELDLADVLTDEGLAVQEQLDSLCIAEAIIAADGPVERIVRADPAEHAAWRGVMDAQRVGDLPLDVPALLLQGADDQIIPADETRALHTRLCGRGARSLLVEREGQDHGVEPNPDLVAWISARFAGEPAPTSC